MTAAKKQTSEVVQNIPLEQLRVSLEETRKTIDQTTLKELAESIARHGVQEALIVRAVDLDCMSGEPLPGAAKAKDAYEIVAGQRRWLASKIAGKTTCPCIVREISDDDAREQRINSNLQREDLPPMEAAEAYGKLLEQPGATIETVAAALAKSPSYIGRRVQLLKAIEPVREALKAGAIEVGHALELARLSEQQQSKLLDWLDVGYGYVNPAEDEDEDDAKELEDESGVCKFCDCSEEDACRLEGGVNCSWANEEQTVCTNPDCLARFRQETGQQNGEWQKTSYSIVDLKQGIAEMSYRDLKDAPFPLAADLPPMPCADCPKRAGNSQLLFDDCAQDTCTDRPCFNRKVNAWIESQLDAARDEKRKLLKLTSSYTSDKDRVYCTNYGSARELKMPDECPHGEEGIWIDGHNAGLRVIVCRNQKCETHFGKHSSHPSGSERPKQTEKEKADRRKVLDKVKAEKVYRAALTAAIAAVEPDAKIAAELAIDVCCGLIEKTNSLYVAALARTIGWDERLMHWDSRKKLRDQIASLPAARQLLIARLSEEAGELSVSEYNCNGKCEDLEKLGRMVGVDAKKIRANSVPAKATAKAAPKAAKKSAAKPAKQASAKKAAAKPAKKAAKKGGK
jgi:ParB/RepB/Spo0J family partition protein